jgi:uncharacterized protein GlcG (DUF336 family)
MSELTLDKAQAIIAGALAHARTNNLKPLAVAVLDERGAYKALAVEDGTPLRRAEIAHGKAHGAIAMGIGSRALGKAAVERPHFIAAVTHAVGGALIPVPGGVLIRSTSGAVLGAVGVSGDVSDNDEAAAAAGIAAAGFAAETG